MPWSIRFVPGHFATSGRSGQVGDESSALLSSSETTET